MQVEFKGEVPDAVKERVSSFVKMTVKAGADEELMPVFMLANSVKNDNRIVAAPFTDGRSKDMASHAVAKMASEMDADLIYYALESYFLQLGAGMSPEDVEREQVKWRGRLQEHPNAREAIFIQFETKAGSWATRLMIDTSSGRRIELPETLVFDNSFRSEGRFTNLLKNKAN